MKHVPVILPVRYREHDGSRYVHRLGTVETTLRTVSRDEAPLVVQFTEDGFAGQRSELDYRAFDGRLMVAAAPIGLDFDGSTLRPNAVVVRGDYERFALRHKEPWSENQMGDIPAYSFGPHDTDAYRLMAGRVLDKASRAVMVEGQLFVPSAGPVMCFNMRAYQRPRRPTLKYMHGENVHANLVEELAFRFSALDDTALDTIRRHFEGAGAVHGNPPRVISKEGYSIDMSAAIAEATAWQMIWYTRDLTMEQAGTDIVEASLRIRQALAARWPGQKLDWRPIHHGWAYPHVNDETIPPPDDLLPSLRRMFEASAGVMSYGTVTSWGMSVDRVARAIEARPTDDHEIMAGMDFR